MGPFLRQLAAMIFTDDISGSLLLLLMEVQPPAQFEVLAVVGPYCLCHPSWFHPSYLILGPFRPCQA